VGADSYLAYLDEVQRQLEKARSHALGAVAYAAEIISTAIAEGRVLYAFGPSHAGLVVQDLFYRAGGLLPVEPILPAGLMLNERPVTRTTHLERLPGYGELLLRDTRLAEGDILLLVSVSGRNPVVVEMASGAKARGAQVIALTSLTYSQAVLPRNGAKRLFEVADLVIDLPGCQGDAAIELPGLTQRVGPTSTTVGSAILNGMVVEISARLLDKGIAPPVLVSGNQDHGDESNEALFESYRTQLSYL